MENNKVDSIPRSAVASEATHQLKVPKGTLVIKSNFDKIKIENDADKLREQASDRLEEGTKNLEKIRDKLTELTTIVNKDMDNRSKNLSFSVDKVTNQLVVTVSEKESGKVIKQIPSETILKVAHSMEALKGILYDEKY
jgi:uncharacterized FlaG/YvyC family protein